VLLHIIVQLIMLLLTQVLGDGLSTQPLIMDVQEVEVEVQVGIIVQQLEKLYQLLLEMEELLLLFKIALNNMQLVLLMQHAKVIWMLY